MDIGACRATFGGAAKENPRQRPAHSETENRHSTEAPIDPSFVAILFVCLPPRLLLLYPYGLRSRG